MGAAPTMAAPCGARRNAAAPSRAPRIVFSDLDGTFLATDKSVLEPNLRALDALAAAGGIFVPCSGRPLSGIPGELLAHPATRFAIGANGALTVELDARDQSAEAAAPIRRVPLSRDAALAVLDAARGHEVTFDVFADGRSYLERSWYDRLGSLIGDPMILKGIRMSRTPVDWPPEESIARAGSLERIAMYWRDPAERDAVLAGLAGIGHIEVTRSHPTNIEVMGEGCTKGAALAWLCGHAGIDRADAMAFGDNLNDIEMIRAAGTGVAVGNAEPEVKAAADAVCPSNDEAGVGAFLLGVLG